MHITVLVQIAWYICCAGPGHCSSITFGRCHFSDLLTELQNIANGFVCCLAVGAILDAHAMGIPTRPGCWCCAGHHEWLLR